MGNANKKPYRCPSCKKQHDGAGAHHLSPFCSERCQLVDLGAWMQESYSIPIPAEEFVGNQPTRDTRE